MAMFDMAQHARLVTLACPGVAAPLVVEQFTGREAINALFVFTVDVLATSADLDIDAMIGQPMTLAMLQPDGARRAWHGLCTHAGARGADGGLARYQLRLEPALAQLRLRRDSHLFQDQDAQSIVTELLRDYPQVRCTFDIKGQLAQRAICTQYRETDFDFFCRLLASEGLNYRFDHAEDGHRLVVFDADATVPGDAVLRFYGVRATDTDDAIDLWHACRRIQANDVVLASWDPDDVGTPSAHQSSGLDAGTLPALSIYDGSGERIASGPQAPGGLPATHAARMLQALEQANKVCEGAGGVRRLAAGHRFTLTQHAHYPDGENAFTVLWVEHAARNNIRASIKGAGTAIDDGTYRNTFACVRNTVALVPPATAAAHPSTAHGTQTALVVGLPDAVATTNRDHQVRIQFAWQRGMRPNPGGLAHPGVGGGNAPGNATCGAWVRVAEALAGPNWGSQFIPRLGTEVLVAFIEGDIDRPVIVGQLHNGVAPPPFAAGVDASAGHDGVLSGIHTETFDGNGFNQWQLDDTQGQLRMRLASSSAASELHLGHLVRQAYGAASRGEPRGSGFELRTDAWMVLRGAQGVLLSTSARPAAGSSVTSTQMDAQEAVARFKGAAALDDALVQAAQQHQALASTIASDAQASFIKGADPAAQGKYDGPVNGQDVAKARSGSRKPDAAQPVERLHAPGILLDAAATMNWATPASTVVSAGQHLHWTTLSDTHLAAGAGFASVAGGSASLFAHAGGVRAIAANGPVSLQAHTDALEIVADQDVVVVSVGDAVSIQARTRIVLQAGQSSVTLDGGDITFACPGTFAAKGGQHVFDGGGSAVTSITKLPDSRLQLFDQAFILKNKKTGLPTPRQPYRLQLADGTFEEGSTDEKGQTHVVTSAQAEQVAIAVIREESKLTAARPMSRNPDNLPKFKVLDKTVTTPIHEKKRHEVMADLPACWVEDHEAEIEVQAAEKYYSTTETDGERVVFPIRVRYRISLPVKTNNAVVIQVRFKIELNFFNEQEKSNEEELPMQEKSARQKNRRDKIEAMKVAAERGVRLAWSNKFVLEIVDPVCGTISMPVVYELKWTEADEHFSMVVHDAMKLSRENVRHSTMNVTLDSTSWTFAHEFGHCVGLPDEYSTSSSEERIVRYHRPDGTLDVAIVANRDDEEKPDSEQTIQSTYNCIVLLPRHGWNVAIEAQELLSEKTGRPIKCNIVKG